MELDFGGFDGLIGALDELAGPVAEEAMSEGVKAGAAVIAEAMREAAPVLDHRRAKSTALPPGALKDDIRVSSIRKDKDGYVEAEIGPGRRTQHVALWVEYGHREVRGGESKALGDGKTRGPGREIGRVPEHPFLRPAFEESEGKALEACAAAASDVIGKGGKR